MIKASARCMGIEMDAHGPNEDILLAVGGTNGDTRSSNDDVLLAWTSWGCQRRSAPGMYPYDFESEPDGMAQQEAERNFIFAKLFYTRETGCEATT